MMLGRTFFGARSNSEEEWSMAMATARPEVLVLAGVEVTTHAWEGRMKSSKSVTKTDMLRQENKTAGRRAKSIRAERIDDTVRLEMVGGGDAHQQLAASKPLQLRNSRAGSLLL